MREPRSFPRVRRGEFHHRRGFHPTGIVASFGSALAASRLMKLDAERTAMVQGIAYATASGNQEFVSTMAWTKRMHPDWCAVGGITSAALASEGFTGPLTPYEGKFGLYRLFLGGDDWDYALATKALYKKRLIEDIAVKPLPACYFNIPLIDAALRIVAEHRPLLREIDQVQILIPEAAINTICEPQALKRRPTVSYSAEFSGYYAVAIALARARFLLDDITAQALSDPSILALADKFIYKADPKSKFPQHYSGAVIVHMRDGRSFEAREDVDRGSSERPLSETDIIRKFQENAERTPVKEKTSAIIDAVMHLERCTDVRNIAGLLSTN